MRDFCADRVVFDDGPSNAANCISLRPTPVAMATKFGTKWAITWLAQEIFAPIGEFTKMRHRMLPIAFSPTDSRCHGNKIWDKIGYNSVCVRHICEIFASKGFFGSDDVTPDACRLVCSVTPLGSK